MSDARGRYRITLWFCGEQYEFFCSGREHVFNAMRRAGIRGLPNGCGGGGCGVCKVQVIAGSAHARRMSCAHITREDLRQNIVLACCITPDSDMELQFCGAVAPHAIATKQKI